MPFQLCALSSWSFASEFYAGNFNLYDLPDCAKQHGFDWIECNDFMLPPPRFSRITRPLFDKLMPGAPADLWRYRGPIEMRMQAAMQRANVRCLAWTLNTDFTATERDWSTQCTYIGAGLGVASLLGARFIRVILGGGEQAPREADAIVTDRLADIAFRCAGATDSIALVVENHWGMSTDCERMVRIVRAARAELPAPARERLGICLDPTNTPSSPSARMRAWQVMAPLALHAHFKTHFRAGEEQADYAELFALLKQSHYRGDFTLEATGDLAPAVLVAKSIALWQNLQSAA